MQCPACQGQELRAEQIGRVNAEQCPSCGGVFFDAGELEQARDAAEPDLRWMDFELWSRPDRFNVSARPQACPKCDKPLAAVEYGDTGVEVHACPACHGMWLDGGAFERIIAALEREAAQMDTGDYVRESLEEARDLLTHPQHLPREWRDFTSVLRMMEYRVLSSNPRLRAMLEELGRDAQFF